MIYKTNSGYGVNFNQVATKPINNRTLNGITYTVNSDGTITANGTATALSYYVLTYPTGRLAVGHKYLLRGCPQNGSGSTYHLVENTNGAIDYGSGTIWVYFSPSSSAARQWVFYIISGTTVNNLTFSFQCFDLTQMFGSGNEPTTVAEFREMYSNDYYDYTLSQWQWAKKGKITSYPTPVIENGTTLLPIENHIVGLAHYNDGNTDIIYNYAKRELPVGFVRLDYIESTGTQYIDTGLSSFCDFEIMSQVSEGQPNKTFGNYFACLERRNAANPHWQLLFIQGETVYSSVSVYNKTKNSLRNGVWKVNDETVATLDFDYYRGSFAYLFAVDDISFYPQKIFYLKTWDKQGNMTRNFIPCYRFSDGIEGLYDTVGKQFYTNQGTGRFIRGKEIDSGNLLDLSKFVQGYPSNTSEAPVNRTFSEGTYVTGLTSNNYYNPTYYIRDFTVDLQSNSISFIGSGGGGIGFVVRLKRNTKYRIYYNITGSTVALSTYYSADGTYLGSVRWNSRDAAGKYEGIITTPTYEFEYALILFRQGINDRAMMAFSNISLHEVN